MNLADVELSHLRYFVALAEELHFGRAAARLHMAQPPLTRQIKLLEERLQCGLFERTPRSTRLTPAGEMLLQRARAILADADEIFGAMRRAGRGEEGSLAVATAPSLMLTNLPRVIRAFRKAYPRVTFRLSEMASSAILRSVNAGTVDVGFVRGTELERDIHTCFRWQEPLVAIVPLDHRLRRKRRFQLADLRDEPFVFFPREIGPSFFDEVMGWCKRAGFVPNVVQEARQWSSILSLVNAGMGVSVGPVSLTELLPAAVVCLRLQAIYTSVSVVTRPGAAATPALTNFLRIASSDR